MNIETKVMDQSNTTEPAAFEPATILVTACPAAGKEAKWEEAMGELVRASLSFPGHLGTTVLKPTAGTDRQYRVITKFENAEQMEGWKDSDERKRRVEQIVKYEAKPANIHFVTGLETWFELPPHGVLSSPEPPPKYKMAVIIWIAVYFTVLPLIAFLKPVFSPLPPLLGSAIMAVASVVLMTWIVMPALTTIFRFWLYPKNAAHHD